MSDIFFQVRTRRTVSASLIIDKSIVTWSNKKKWGYQGNNLVERNHSTDVCLASGVCLYIRVFAAGICPRIILYLALRIPTYIKVCTMLLSVALFRTLIRSTFLPTNMCSTFDTRELRNTARPGSQNPAQHA